MQPLLQWKSVKYYIFCAFVDLVDQLANRLRHTIICSLYGSINFSHIAHKQGDIWKKSVEHKSLL
jgi:hypothetical protein